MYTSLTIAFVSFFVPTLEGPTWSSDYWAARKQGVKDGKPLAVFVGSGTGGFEKISQEGKLNPKIRQTLTTHYVCVYLDTSTKAGEELAREFAINQGLGLVISDRNGQLQAFHQDGDISASELVHHLQKFANPNLEVQTTSTNQRTSFYPPNSNGGQTSTFVPATRGRNC